MENISKGFFHLPKILWKSWILSNIHMIPCKPVQGKFLKTKQKSLPQTLQNIEIGAGKHVLVSKINKN